MIWLLPIGVAAVVGGLAVAAGRARRSGGAASASLTPAEQGRLMEQQLIGFFRERDACVARGISMTEATRGTGVCPGAERLRAAVITSAKLLGMPQFAAALSLPKGQDTETALAKVTEYWPRTNLKVWDYIVKVIVPKAKKLAAAQKAADTARRAALTPSPMAPKG